MARDGGVRLRFSDGITSAMCRCRPSRLAGYKPSLEPAKVYDPSPTPKEHDGTTDGHTRCPGARAAPIADGPETIRPSTCRRRSLLLAAILAAGLSLGKGERAVAATVGLTTRGVLTINGAPAFPIGLSDPPGIGALAPGGQNGLDVVASAGVRVFRVVPPDGSWGAGDNTVPSEIKYAHQWDVAAT